MTHRIVGQSTHELFSGFAGKRVDQDKLLKEACDKLDSLSCSDLSTLLLFMSETRVGQLAVSNVVEGNRFHKPSEIEQRDFHELEGHIMNSLPSVPFIELSGLQPFGTSTLISGTNIKNVIPALRRSEVNADASTALFRAATSRYITGGKSIRVATNTRATRAQIYDKEDRFLPHFKVFAEVSIGRQGEKYDPLALRAFIDHLRTEINIVDGINRLEGFSIRESRASIGNVLMTEGLLERGLLDRDEIRRNTTTPGFEASLTEGLNIPAELPMDTPNLRHALRSLGFTRGVVTTERFQQELESYAPDLLSRLTLNLGRVAGLNYYEHLCFHIKGMNIRGEWVPLSDGGTNDWGKRVTGDKLVYTVTSGIGTELICRHFKYK